MTGLMYFSIQPELVSAHPDDTAIFIKQGL